MDPKYKGREDVLVIKHKSLNTLTIAILEEFETCSSVGYPDYSPLQLLAHYHFVDRDKVLPVVDQAHKRHDRGEKVDFEHLLD